MDGEAIFYQKIITNIITSKESWRDKYIRVEKSGLLVPKELTLLNYTNKQAQDILFLQGKKNLSPIEYIEFLKAAREQDFKLYKKLTEKGCWSGEWLDGRFEGAGKDMRMIYHAYENGKIVQKSDLLDDDTLIEDRAPGISLDSLIENPTAQGLPKISALSGEIYSWAPKDGAQLGFFVVPNSVIFFQKAILRSRDGSIGVRAAERLK